MSQDGVPLHPGWGDATSENRINKLKFPFIWLSGPEWRRPVPSALFGDECQELGYTILLCLVGLFCKAARVPPPGGHKAMAVSRAEILKYVSAMRLFDNQREVKKPSAARPYAHSLTYTLRENSQPPQLRTHTHKSLYRSPSFLLSSEEWAQSHW